MTAHLPHVVSHLSARDDRPDSALLNDFLRAADEAAFAELVRRHGPMVLGVCRRVLGRSADADDAFQATFLVLVRRARQTVWRAALGPWLHGVAVRTARKIRFVRARQLATERQAFPMMPEPAALAPAFDDSAAVLDEELAALPDVYRRPLVLCELQGKSRRDAARELELAEGTLSSRLARGRQLLRARLTRRGVGLATAGLSVTVPADLAAATAGRAVAVLTGAAGVVPAGLLALTEGVVKTMIVNWKRTAVVIAAGIGLAGFGGWAGRPGAVAADPLAASAPPVKSSFELPTKGELPTKTDVADPRPVAAPPIKSPFELTKKGELPTTADAIVYRLRNAAAPDVARQVTEFAAQKKLTVTVAAEPVSNSVFVAGDAAARDQIAKLLPALDPDVPQFVAQMMLMQVPAGFAEEIGLSDRGEDSWVLTPREVRMLTAAIRKEKDTWGRLDVLSRPQILLTNNRTGSVQVNAMTARVTPRVLPEGSTLVRFDGRFERSAAGAKSPAADMQGTETVPPGGTVVFRGMRSKTDDGRATEVLVVMTVDLVHPPGR